MLMLGAVLVRSVCIVKAAAAVAESEAADKEIDDQTDAAGISDAGEVVAEEALPGAVKLAEAAKLMMMRGIEKVRKISALPQEQLRHW